MILIGQYDSPFTRRVGIALTLYGLPFEHRPWSVFGDAAALMRINPLGRVPVLLLAEGEALIDSHIILDHLDSLMPAAERLVPLREPARRRALKVAALATGLGDRVVSLFYERRLHAAAALALTTRLEGQIAATLAELERRRAAVAAPYWHGPSFGHADIAVACVLRHLREALPDLMGDHPALAAHCAGLEALPVFQAISQAFVPPS